MLFKQNSITISTVAILLLLTPLISSADGRSFAASTDRHEDLLARYQQIKPALLDNQYGAPIYIQSRFGDKFAQGDVYALVQHEFSVVAEKLNSPDHWCEVVLLHINVKGCNVDRGANRHVSRNSSRDVTVYVGRNHYQTPDEAHEMLYKFIPKVYRDNYVQVDLTAKNGPLGTSDYRLTFEAIPFDEHTSFIHFQYAYQYGFLARLALDGYLATLGRHKVGFSVKGYDSNNEPLYVKGLQGIVERNSMRYFIAIRSYLDTASLHPRQWHQRIDRWYDLAKSFKRQLVEVRDEKYMKTKTQEYNDRLENNKDRENSASVDTGHAAGLTFDG